MEDETSKCERLEDISYRYFTSGFASDLFVLLPWGYMFTYFNPRLKFMWLIKAVRIKELLHYMSNKVILGPVHSYYEIKQQKCLNDPNLRCSIDVDCIFITDKILSSQILKMMRLIVFIMICTYFVGQYWYIFTLNIHEFGVTSFLDYGDEWNIIEEDQLR